jgi:hypothetical protein
LGCSNPLVIQEGAGRSFGEYFVHNNNWNDNYGGTHVIHACDADDWYADVNIPNHSDNAVEAYLNVHKDYDNEPLANIQSGTFAAEGPQVAGTIWNMAWDIWMGSGNDGSPFSHELMIWTENFGQRPAGNQVGTTVIGGFTYEVWRLGSGDGGIITYLSTVPQRSGTMPLAEFFADVRARGWTPTTTWQVDFGVETVDTNGTTQRFTFTGFSIVEGPPPTTTTSTTTTTTSTTSTTVPPTTTTQPPTTTTVPATTTTTTPTAGLCGPVDQNITGTQAGFTVPQGENWRVTGTLNLTGDAHVEGCLSARAGVTINGNGNELMVMADADSMGRLDFDGGDGGPRWTEADGGSLPTGWTSGMMVLAAPHTPGARNATTVTLGSVLPNLRFPVPTQADRPTELVRTDAGITVNEVSRIMFMRPGFDGVGDTAPLVPGCPCPSLLSNVSVVDSGNATADGGLGHYPIHFHRLGDNVRGTLVEHSLVLRGRNHAYVAHQSHGVTFSDSVAVDPAGAAFWWDVREAGRGTPPDASSASDDVVYNRVGVLGQRKGNGVESPPEVTSLLIGHGVGNVMRDSWVAGTQLQGVANGSCIHWASPTNSFPDTWVVERITCHNGTAENGHFWWYNHTGSARGLPHFVVDNIIVDFGSNAVRVGAYNQSSEPAKYENLLTDGRVLLNVQGVNPNSQEHVTFTGGRVDHFFVGHHNATGRVESSTVRPSFEMINVDTRTGVVINEADAPRTQIGRGRFSGVTVNGAPLTRADVNVVFIQTGSVYSFSDEAWPGTVDFTVS